LHPVLGSRRNSGEYKGKNLNSSSILTARIVVAVWAARCGKQAISADTSCRDFLKEAPQD
jgi:hypothetical protein